MTSQTIPHLRPEGEPAARDPLYAQVARTLRGGILDGTHPVGAQLPTEDELCARFAVSRHTVREALRRLREDGLVVSRQGAGTVVAPPRPSEPHTLQTTSINDLASFAAESRFVIETIGMAAMTDALARRIHVPRGGEWLTVKGHRRALLDAAPLCWAEYYVARPFAGVARLLQRHTGPIFPLIEDMFAISIAEVEQEITAIQLSGPVAEDLGVAHGAVALEVRRVYRTGDGAVVQATVNVHPAERFSHVMTMRRFKPKL